MKNRVKKGVPFEKDKNIAKAAEEKQPGAWIAFFSGNKPKKMWGFENGGGRENGLEIKMQKKNPKTNRADTSKCNCGWLLGTRLFLKINWLWDWLLQIGHRGRWSPTHFQGILFLRRTVLIIDFLSTLVIQCFWAIGWGILGDEVQSCQS